MSTALVRTQHEVTHLRTRLSRLNARHHAEQGAQRIQSVAVAGATGYLWGNYVKGKSIRNEAVPTIGGLPPAITFAAAAYVAAPYIGGRMGEVMADASLALVAIYGNEAGEAAASAAGSNP